MNKQITRLSIVALVLLAGLVIATTYWQTWAVASLADRQDNAIRRVAEFKVRRGLVYSALWNATTKTSTPMNQHWHNFDPKNLQKIYGAQVGAQLHDCNNFNFSYDPIVRNAYGFTGGSVKVIDYQELGT